MAGPQNFMLNAGIEGESIQQALKKYAHLIPESYQT